MDFERIRVWRHLLGGSMQRELGSLGSNQTLQSQAEMRANLSDLRNHVGYEDKLENLQFAVIDTETTGFSPSADQLLSVAAVKLDGWDELLQTTFHTYVELAAGVIVPEAVVQLTGITPDRLIGAPKISAVLTNFLQFVEDRIIVAHHAGFDIRFLNTALRKSFGIELSTPVLDTGKIAMLCHPFNKYPTLDMLLSLYEIPITDRHSAIGDALMTAELFVRELKMLSALGIDTLGQVWERLLWLERQHDQR